MATTTDEAKSSIAKVGATVRAPLIITIAVIAVVGGGYYAFYRSQVEYYTRPQPPSDLDADGADRWARCDVLALFP